MDESYKVYHFGLALPSGEGQDNVPDLLRHLAGTLDKMDENIEILDIVFSNEIDSDGNDSPSFTVYYDKNESKEASTR